MDSAELIDGRGCENSHWSNPTVSRFPPISRPGLRSTIAPVTQRFANDTAAEIEARQARAWGEMTPAQKADLITGLSIAAREMALAGLRDRYPAASARELFLRLAILNLGSELARRAYPEIDHLGLS